MIKRQIIIGLVLGLSLFLNATPPEPPEGKRWVLNEQFSDEFNGTELDDTKWFDYHPNWKGRAPGLFMPSQVKVEEGYLKVWGENMAKDTIVNGDTFNIKCGAVTSVTKEAFFGYYESRFKVGKTTLSGTFWLSSHGRWDGPEDCADNYGTELDIQECIGREGNFNGSWFAKGMHSNAHFWYKDCEGKNNDFRAPEVRFSNSELESAAFHTYGGWWRDANNASYYYDNGKGKNQKFYDDVLAEPFNKPLKMNMVVEVYPFPWIELPSKEELADPENSMCLYDWVRSYTLADIDDSSAVVEVDTAIFKEEVTFLEKPDSLDPISEMDYMITYKAGKNQEIWLELLDSKENVIDTAYTPALGGYGKKSLKLLFDSELIDQEIYTVKIYIRPAGSENNDNAYHSDSFEFKIVDPANIVSVDDILEGSIVVYPNPAKDLITIKGVPSDSNYRLINTLGVVCDQGNLNDEYSIDIKLLSEQSLYFLQIDNEYLVTFYKK